MICGRKFSWFKELLQSDPVNVIFHTLGAVASAAALSSFSHSVSRTDRAEQSATEVQIRPLVAGFLIGVLLHGCLDSLPHNYPFRPAWDIFLSLALFSAFLFVAKSRYRLLLFICFLGAIFPDLLDLGPAILNHRLGWSLPTVKIFPWHWPQYSGSIYDGGSKVESYAAHLCAAGLFTAVLIRFRREFFWES